MLVLACWQLVRRLSCGECGLMFHRLGRVFVVAVLCLGVGVGAPGVAMGQEVDGVPSGEPIFASQDREAYTEQFTYDPDNPSD